MPPEYPLASNPIGVLIAEAPGHTEIFECKPLIGPTGRELNYILRKLDVRRSALHITNAVKCALPKGIADADWKRAVQCCSPSLRYELRKVRSPWLMPMGKPALYAVLGHTRFAATLGFVTHRGIFRVVPNWHPTYALIREPRYRVIFGEYLRRFVGLSRGAIAPWAWGECIAGTGDDVLSALRTLRKTRSDLCVDVENLPTQDVLTCVGLSDGQLAVTVPWETYVNGDHGVVAGLRDLGARGREIRALVTAILTDGRGIYAHNAAHDQTVLGSRGIKTRLAFDTYVAHTIAWPQLPHNLEDVTLQYYHADRWKKAFHADTDTKGSDDFVKKPWVELAAYNGRDTLAGAIIVDPLREDLASLPKGTWRYNRKVWDSRLAVRCSQHGVMLSAPKLEAHAEKLEALRTPLLDRVFGIGKRYGMPDGWNPGSQPQLGELLYKRVGERCFYYTDGLQRSVGAKALARIRDRGDTRAGIEIAKLVSNVRHLDKLRSSYVNKLLGYAREHGGVYNPDLNPCGAQTGRWSSFIHTIPRNKASSDSLEHIPIRDCFVARPGRWVVDVDFSQLELRMIALLAGDKQLLEAYAAGRDVHAENAELIFRDPSKRDLAKGVAYQVNYGSSDLKRCAEATWEKVKVNFPDLTLPQMKAIVIKWFDLHEEIHRWRINQLALAETRDYSEEPFTKRRRYYYGKVKETEVFNYSIQSGGGYVMDEALRRVEPHVDWDRIAILFPWHDALVCDTSDPLYAWDVLMRGMTITLEYRGNKMVFEVGFEIGRDLGNLVKCKTREDVARYVEVISGK